MQSNSGPRPELVLATGHGSAVVAAAVSPDGQTLATGSQDESVILWDLQSREMLGPPLPCTHPWNLRFSPDGRTLAAHGRTFTRCGAGELTLWEVPTRRVRLHRAAVECRLLDFASDGRLLGAGPLVKDGTTWIGRYDPETGIFEPLWDTAWEAFRCLVNGHAHIFRSQDGTVIAGCTEREVRLWDAETGALIRKRKVPDQVRWSNRDPVTEVLCDSEHAASARAELLAPIPEQNRVAMGNSSTLWLMDIRSGRKTRLLACGDGVWSLAASPRGTLLASGHAHGGLVFWRMPSGRVEHETRAAPHGVWVRAVTFTPDGSRVVSGANNREIRVWDTARAECVGRMATLDAEVREVAYSPDGSCLASGHTDGTVRIWDTRTGSLVQTLAGEIAHVSALAFTPDGASLAAGGHKGLQHNDRCRVELWDIAAGEKRMTLRVGGHYTRSLSISPDGEFLVHAAYLDRTEVWNLRTGELYCAQKVTTAALSPNGRWVAVSPAFHNPPSLWALGSGALSCTLEPLPGNDLPVSFRFSPDGDLLYGGGDGFQVGCWNLETGKLLWAKRAERDYFGALALSPDGTTLAFGTSYAHPAWIWDISGPQPVERHRIAAHRGGVYAAAFSPDGATFATGSEDATVKFWDPVTGDLLRTLAVLPADGREPSKDWICHTPNGEYHGSPGAERFVRWAVNGQFVPGPAP